MPISRVAPRGSVKDKVSVVISKEVVVGVAMDAGGETGRRTGGSAGAGGVTETGGIGTSETKLGIEMASLRIPSPLLMVASDPRLFNVATEVVLSVLRC